MKEFIFIGNLIFILAEGYTILKKLIQELVPGKMIIVIKAWVAKSC